MYHDVRNFRDFLKALAEQSWVSEVVIVAHSLGARLVVPAVASVDRAAAGSDSRNISNIILASPDIDRETFERDISADVLAAAKVARARRITVYVRSEQHTFELQSLMRLSSAVFRMTKKKQHTRP